MLRILKINSIEDLEKSTGLEELISFLYKHLDRFRDDPPAIQKAIEYAFSTEAGKGGYILLAFEDNDLIGALVMNETGMSLYIPENILVYIAVHERYRGKGIGSEIIKRAISESNGPIALHVEYDNPAKHLYEKLGFTNKYAEMRLNKEN